MKRWIVGVVVLLAVALGLLVVVARLRNRGGGDFGRKSEPVTEKTVECGAEPGSKKSSAPVTPTEEDGDEPESEAEEEARDEEPMTEEERREAEEEKLVNAFDDLTDAWMEPQPAKVTMDEINRFVASFKRIPKARQDECVHRALNLIPDENVMLLAGILLDKGMDKEIVETVYNDVLNRDEDVKKPILQQLFKDKTHPCWADTAWILDVTGELPKKE